MRLLWILTISMMGELSYAKAGNLRPDEFIEFAVRISLDPVSLAASGLTQDDACAMWAALSVQVEGIRSIVIAEAK